MSRQRTILGGICRHGHLIAGENVAQRKGGLRCRICEQEASRDYQQKRRRRNGLMTRAEFLSPVNRDRRIKAAKNARAHNKRRRPHCLRLLDALRSDDPGTIG